MPHWEAQIRLEIRRPVRWWQPVRNWQTGDAQKILQHAITVGGQNGLWVKLDSVGRMVAVFDSHDLVVD